MQTNLTGFSTALENCQELVRVGKNEKGEDLFSTRTMMMSEKTMLNNAREMKFFKNSHSWSKISSTRQQRTTP